MNGRDNLESSEFGLPGENVETPIAIRVPRVKKDVWLAAAAAVDPRTNTLIAVKARGPSSSLAPLAPSTKHARNHAQDVWAR